MKKIAVFFACGLFLATFIACSGPAEVHTKEKGEGGMVGVDFSDPDNSPAKTAVSFN